jgi:hypothetical protein
MKINGLRSAQAYVRGFTMSRLPRKQRFVGVAIDEPPKLDGRLGSAIVTVSHSACLQARPDKFGPRQSLPSRKELGSAAIHLAYRAPPERFSSPVICARFLRPQ